MSDGDALTAAELDELQRLLEKSRDDVEASRAASSADAKPVDLDLSIGRLSRVDALQQQHMALARRQRGELQLQQIRSALARVALGSYGGCARCGEPIGYARLRVRPEAPLCHSCQSGGGG